jgi:hypothetical protein
MRFSRLAGVGAHRAQWVPLRPSTPMGWLMGSRQRMQRATFKPSGRVFILGLPAEAKVPRTSFTVRLFSFLCPNPEDSRSKESARRGAKGLALGRKSSGEEGGCQAQLHKKARADSSVWECRRAVRSVHPCPLYGRLAAGCRLPR